MNKINMHVMFWSTPTVRRSSVSNMPCLHLAHHSDLARVKSQTQHSKSRTKKSDNGVHTEVFTNPLRLSCANHPPIVKSRNTLKDRTPKVTSPFQGPGFAKHCIFIPHGVTGHSPISVFATTNTPE